MDILAIILFLLIIGVSIYDEGVQPGLLAIAAGTFIAIVIGGWSYEETIALFPTSLFLTLTGILLFFGVAVANGTIANIVNSFLYHMPAYPALIPFALAGGVVLLTAMGVGNIGATAILAPAAMAISFRLKLKPLLMILLIVGAANAGALSPLAVTGVTVRELLSHHASGFDHVDLSAFGLRLFGLSFLIQTIVAFAGFFLLGGVRWMREVSSADLESEPSVWTRDQKLTVVCIGGFVLTVLLASLPFFPREYHLARWGGQIAVVAFAWLSVLLIFKAADPKTTLLSVPWSSILMVTGIVMYIEVASKAGAIELLTGWLVSSASTALLPPLIFAFSALLSVFSSSSGVVMPLFVALAPGLASAGTTAQEIVTGVGISAHLVDTSPLSSLGALCIAAANAQGKTEGLFRSLLLWALLMVPLGALISWMLASF